MKTSIIAIISATLLPFLSSCDQAQAQPKAVNKTPYEYKIISASLLGDNEPLNQFVEQGWEAISVGGAGGMGSGNTAVLLRRAK
jgi:hypothetical protein